MEEEKPQPNADKVGADGKQAPNSGETQSNEANPDAEQQSGDPGDKGQEDEPGPKSKKTASNASQESLSSE